MATLPYSAIEGQLAVLESQQTIYLTERGWVTTVIWGVDETMWEKGVAKGQKIVAPLEVAVRLERQMELFALEHASDPRFHAPDQEEQ